MAAGRSETCLSSLSTGVHAALHCPLPEVGHSHPASAAASLRGSVCVLTCARFPQCVQILVSSARARCGEKGARRMPATHGPACARRGERWPGQRGASSSWPRVAEPHAARSPRVICALRLAAPRKKQPKRRCSSAAEAAKADAAAAASRNRPRAAVAAARGPRAPVSNAHSRHSARRSQQVTVPLPQPGALDVALAEHSAPRLHRLGAAACGSLGTPSSAHLRQGDAPAPAGTAHRRLRRR